jgi:hypothetical protein
MSRRKTPPTPPYRSHFEENVAKGLRKKRRKFGYEDVKINYAIPESKHTYTPDFTLSNGVIIEAKGKWDHASRKKMLLVIKQNPDLDIRMLFMRAKNKIRKGSQTSYADFCDKHDIIWAQGPEVPKEWLK